MSRHRESCKTSVSCSDRSLLLLHSCLNFSKLVAYYTDMPVVPSMIGGGSINTIARQSLNSPTKFFASTSLVSRQLKSMFDI